MAEPTPVNKVHIPDVPEVEEIVQNIHHPEKTDLNVFRNNLYRLRFL